MFQAGHSFFDGQDERVPFRLGVKVGPTGCWRQLASFRNPFATSHISLNLGKKKDRHCHVVTNFSKAVRLSIHTDVRTYTES